LSALARPAQASRMANNRVVPLISRKYKKI
jgi:hypothetical protein